MIIHPQQLNAAGWADSMAYLLSGGTPIMKLEDPEKWREWALNLSGQPNFIGQNVPNPHAFESWRDWAERLFETVELEG